MRRLTAILAVVALIGSLAASSVAAAPPVARVNHFAGNFDMLIEGTDQVVGHIVVDFREPTLERMVPGTLDVTWEPYDPANPPFPFMALDWPPVKESHAQLLSAGFNTYDDQYWGHVVSGGAEGFLCDYTAPWNAGCRYFSVIFQTTTLGPARVANWSEGDGADPDRIVFEAGRGSFVLTYAGTTGT